MFIEETLWIREALGRHLQDGPCDVLDIGSSSYEYRTKVQPHIAANVFAPLEEWGCSITFADIKEEDGIDLVLNLSVRDIDEDVFAKKYDLILCCNILEHVPDRDVFLENLSRFSKAGSLILVTVPYKYPKHNDPIDTMYRPNTRELLDLLSDHVTIAIKTKATISISDRKYYRRNPGRKLDYLLPLRFNKMWRFYIKPFRWKVSAVLVEVT